NHPNILEYYNFKEDERYCYLYTEFIDGLSIDKKLEKLATGSFSNNHMVYSITCRLLDALYYIHKENIIHRDIKSANIMISSKGVVKIIDFGLSKLFENDSKNHSFTGTINYMAPEVLLCNNTASRKSDVWSLACTIIEMTGGDLKKKKEINNQQQKKSKQQYIKEIPTYLAPSLKHFLYNSLNVDPKKRYNISQLIDHPYIKRVCN
ncbi:hypothetical protein DICPUDRAFT_25407, partial [Dictyostelium purpureum]